MTSSLVIAESRTQPYVDPNRLVPFIYTPPKVATLVVGGLFGDEGKGKFVSYLAQYALHVARAGVGTNAGHTIFFNGVQYKLRMVPSGFTNPSAKLYIGKGVLVDDGVLTGEVEKLDEYFVADRLYVDRLCPIIEERHRKADRTERNKGELSTTGSGSGTAQLERVKRSDELRFVKDIQELQNYVSDVSSLLNEAAKREEPILIEGTQGTLISLYGFDFGEEGMTYPRGVTTKDTTAGSFLSDVGLGPAYVKDVIVCYKAIPSKVGNGPFPGEVSPDVKEIMKEKGLGEYGTVSGKERRLGEWNSDIARIGIYANGATQIALSKIDKRFPGNDGITDYRNLTDEARKFIETVEDELERPIVLIGTGPNDYDIIDRRN